MDHLDRPRQIPTPPGYVQLCMSGPKSIISERITAQVNMRSSWLEFFNRQLRLKVATGKGIYVCTSTYNPGAPKEGKGWRADLDEKISDFVVKFQHKRTPVHVRICLAKGIKTLTVNKGLRCNGIIRSPSTTNKNKMRASTQNAAGPSTSGTNGHGGVPSGIYRAKKVASVIPIMGLPLAAQQAKNGNRQQHEHATRQKRRLEQVDTPAVPTSTIRSAGGRQRRVGNACTSNNIVLSPPPPPPLPSQFRTRRTRYYVPPGLYAHRMVNGVQASWNELRDESGAVNGYGAGGANRNQLNGRRDGWANAAVNGGRAAAVHGGVAAAVHGGVAAAVHGGEEATINGGGHEEEDEFTSDSEDGAAYEEEGVLLSLLMAATAEGGQGIQEEDVKSLVMQRMNRLSNNFMLRVKNEIQELYKSDRWITYAMRTPLAFHMLLHIFQL